MSVVHSAFSKNNQYIVTLHSDIDGDHYGHVCIWRGMRHHTTARLGVLTLRRMLLLCRMKRANLEDEEEEGGGLRVLVWLAAAEGAELAGSILAMLAPTGEGM